MSFINFAKDVLRPFRDIASAGLGFLYDYARFYRYAGWRRTDRSTVRDYKAVKIYHRLEKSLSFRERRGQSGIGAAQDLVRHLEKGGRAGSGFTFHEKIGFKVLGDYVDSANAPISDQRIVAFRDRHAAEALDIGGVRDLSADQLASGRLADPESFFRSRASVRDFSPAPVPLDVVEEAVSLALHSPSVCNRQASYVYCLRSREIIDRALSLQNGNRGFGHEVPCLLIICSDLTAFDAAGERYQHWIDGGMFSMSLVWALHALGYASCCLNWSKTPGDDRKIRKLLPVRPEHSIMMMLAVGLPNENIKTCYSARKPHRDHLEILS
ncbi:nitroreductase family protein [Sphingopyxis sp. 550A]